MMNKQMMAKNLGAHAILLPPAIRLDQDGNRLKPASDDYWIVQDVSDAGVTVYEPRSRHTRLLHWDHLYGYTSDVEKNGARRAFLTLRVQMYVVSDEVKILPTRPSEELPPNLALLGIEPTRPAVASQARSLALAKAFEQETETLVIASAQPFHDTCALLFDALNSSLDQIAEDTGWKVVHDDVRTIGKYPQYVARIDGTSLQLLGRDVALNTCRGASLLIRVFNGVLTTPDEERRRMTSMFPPQEVSRLTAPLIRTQAFGWGFAMSGKTLSVPATAEIALEKFMSVHARS